MKNAAANATAKKETQGIPDDLLPILIGLSWTVLPRPEGSSQIRFFWPAKGTRDAQGRHVGKYRAISTGQKGINLSIDRQRILVAEWFIENGFIPKPVAQAGDALLEDEIDRYIAVEYEAKGSPDGTVRGIRQALRRLRETMAKGFPALRIRPIITVQGITPEAFEAAVPLLKLREKAPRAGQLPTLKPKAWKNLMGCIRPFFAWEMMRSTNGFRHLIIDPTLGVATPSKAELRKSRPVRTVWPDDEYEATLAKISFREVALQNGAGKSGDWVKLSRFTLKLLRWGGVDVNEAYRLRANHIEEAPNGKLWIKKLRGKSKKDSGIEVIKLPVSDKLEKEMRGYWETAKAEGPDAPLFPWVTRFNTHESFRSWIWKMVQKARKRAGLPPRDVKSFRHTFTTYHLKRGKVKLAQLREWLGHADDSRMIEDTYDLTEYGDEAMD